MDPKLRTKGAPPATKAKPASSETGQAARLAEDVLKGINDELAGGADVAQMLGSQELAIKIKGVISTQCATIDAATGRGGVPLGRLVILHGGEGSGKTTLALQIAAETQRRGGIVVYMDTEYKLDPEYARNLGVDVDHLVYSQPSYLERAFKTCEGVIKRAAANRESGSKRVPMLVVMDSMNSTITKAQYEGEWDDKHMAPQARAFSSLLPKLIPQVSKEDVCLLWISQVRKKMNVMFGNDEEIAGGQAPRFYASLILKVTRVGSVKDGEGGEKIANKIVVECVKNQIAPPFKKAECEIVYGRGFDKYKAVLVQAEKWGIIEKAGSVYKFGEAKIGNGLAAAAEKLGGDADLYEKLMAEIRTKGKWE